MFRLVLIVKYELTNETNPRIFLVVVKVDCFESLLAQSRQGFVGKLLPDFH